MDGGELRRGCPVPSKIYGPEKTWLAAFAGALVTMDKLLKLNEPKVRQAFMFHHLPRLSNGITIVSGGFINLSKSQLVFRSSHSARRYQGEFRASYS